MVLARRLSGGIAAAVVCSTVVAPARAGTDLEARAGVTAGGTDNVLLDPVNQRASAVTSGRAAVFLNRVGDASSQTLSYGLAAQVYTEPLARSTVFHSLTGNSTWAVGRAGSFNLGLSGTAGRMSALDPVLSAQIARASQGAPLGAPGSVGANGVAAPTTMAGAPGPMQTLLGGRPTGQILFLSGEAREGFDQGIGEFWHLHQLGSAAGYVPLEDAPFVRRAFFLQHLLGTDRDLPRGSAGVQLRLGETITPPLNSPPVMLPGSQISFGEGWASWTHAITPTLESMLSGGAYGIWSFEANRFATGPVWRGRLTYQPRLDQRVSIEASRSIQPSLMLGYTLRSDAIAAEAGRALDHAERWAVLFGANWMRGRQILPDGSTGGLLTVWALRGSLRYDPPGPLRYGLDVSRFVQGGQASDTLVVAETRQLLFLFLVEAIYPSRDRAGQRLMAQN